MLSSLSRFICRLAAACYAGLGLTLFIAPAWSAANFSWKISPFVAVTMGGWCLGNAYTAWESGRLGRWALVYANLTYLWAFGVLEALVLVLFRDKLVLTAPLAWPYLLALALNLLLTALVTAEWARSRPVLGAEGAPLPSWARLLAVVFILFVGFLAAYGWFSGVDGLGTDSSIFPEPLTLFTLRAFAAFYTALALSVVPLIGAKGEAAFVTMGRAGMSFILAITLAALLNLGVFDFATHPGQLVYLGAYVAAFFVIAWFLSRERRLREV